MKVDGTVDVLLSAAERARRASCVSVSYSAKISVVSLGNEAGRRRRRKHLVHTRTRTNTEDIKLPVRDRKHQLEAEASGVRPHQPTRGPAGLLRGGRGSGAALIRSDRKCTRREVRVTLRRSAAH